MSRKRFFIGMTIAAAIAAFFLLVPFAQHYAQQRLGWNQAGQDALAKVLFFPILFLCLYVLRKLAAQKPDGRPGSD